MAYRDVVRSVWAPIPPRNESDLEYLVHYAVLAANSHNTQPWLFSGSGKTVSIQPDWTRTTRAADPDYHHLFVSLGCAAENLTLAATAAGCSAEVSALPRGDDSVRVDIAAGGRGRDPLFDAILDRQCTRSVYDGRPVPTGDLKSLEKAARIDGCTIVLMSDKTRMERALDFVIAANTKQIEDPAFVRELKSWIRFNGSHAAKTRDGLYSRCPGTPPVPSWLGRAIFDFAFKAGSENDRYAKQIRSSSGIAVFISDGDDKAHWVHVGRSFQRFALQATSLGIRHAFINQPVEVAEIRADVESWLGLGLGGGRADLIVRYGCAPPMPRSLRRPVADVIV